jgi:OOP family OmpA-OmpF porin
MRKLMLLLLGAILIGILSYFCFLDKAGTIKDDLLSKAQSAYSSKQMNWVKSTVKGDDLEMTRILILEGTAPSLALKEEAGRIALAQEGVEGVDNRLVVAQTAVAKVEEVPLPEPEPAENEPLPVIVPVDVQPEPVKPEPIEIVDVKIPQKAVFSCQEEFKKILSSQKIHFQYNKADVKASSYTLLDSLVETAKKCPNDAILVAGHTDSVGSKNYNLKLSTNRANRVREYLITHGIDKSRVRAIGYGESKPIADNSTKEGQAKNRRIELNVMDIKDLPSAPKVEKVIKEEQLQEVKSIQTVDNTEDVQFSCEREFQRIFSKDKIHFDYNKASIASNSYKLLDLLADVIKKCPNKIISIEGHTDSIGSKSYNLKLSLNRVNAVKDYLVKKGVSADRLEVVGHGESKPLVSNMLKAGRAKNRRIEFIVKGDK